MRSQAAHLAGGIWALYRPYLMGLVNSVASGGPTLVIDADERLEPWMTSASGLFAAKRGSKEPKSIGVIPIRGVIDRETSFFGTSTEEIGANLTQMVENDRVSSILLDIDSPGGNVFGVEELAGQIREAKQVKPVGAVTPGMMASAAYWIGSQADFVAAAPSAMVGSIGVYTVHEDMSKLLEREGVDVSLISAGKHKVDGNPFEPLSKEARADMQTQVDQYYRMFTGSVAQGRGISQTKVLSDYGQGKVFTAGEAMSAGLVDSVGGLPHAVQAMSEARLAAMDLRSMADEPSVEAEPAPEPVAEQDGTFDIARRRRHLNLQRQKSRLYGPA